MSTIFNVDSTIISKHKNIYTRNIFIVRVRVRKRERERERERESVYVCVCVSVRVRARVCMRVPARERG